MHRPRTPRRQQYIQITDVWATGHRASSNTRCSHLPNPSPSHKHAQDATKHIRPHTSHSCHGSDHRHPQASNQSTERAPIAQPRCGILHPSMPSIRNLSKHIIVQNLVTTDCAHSRRIYNAGACSAKLWSAILQVTGLISVRFWSSSDLRDDHCSDESGGGGGSSLSLIRSLRCVVALGSGICFCEGGLS